MRSREDIEGDVSEEFLSGSEELPQNAVIKNIEIELLLDIRDLLNKKYSDSVPEKPVQSYMGSSLKVEKSTAYDTVKDTVKNEHDKIRDIMKKDYEVKG